MKLVQREKLWQTLRATGPSSEERARMLVQLEAELEPPAPRRRAPVLRTALLATLIAGSTIAAVGQLARRALQAREPAASATVVVPQAHQHPSPPAAPSISTITSPSPSLSPSPSPSSTSQLKRHPIRAISPVDTTSAPKSLPTSLPSSDDPSKRAAQADSLSEQVSEFRRIAALGDRGAAVVAWQRMLERWPRTILRHEIELNIVESLGRLGRRAEVRQAAANFLRHFPKSPRARDMKALLGAEAKP